MDNHQSPVTSHPSSFLDDKLKVAPWFNYLCYALIATGIITFAAGILSSIPSRHGPITFSIIFISWVWPLVLPFLWPCNILPSPAGHPVLSVSPRPWPPIFLWPALFFLILYFGIHAIYHWSASGAVIKSDELIRHKVPFLNVPFFMIRLVIYFGCWTIMTRILAKIFSERGSGRGTELFS